MEQYVMPKELDAENLRLCLDAYQAEHIFIRDCGGSNPDGSYRIQGATKVSECLEGKILDFTKDTDGLRILIDSKEVFHFPLEHYEHYDKGFSLAYERIEPTEDGIGRMVMLSRGIDPYDASLPEPQRSILRHVLDRHLIEISFKGRVNLRFHSWWRKPHWKYWAIDRPGSIQEIILEQQIEYDEEDS